MEKRIKFINLTGFNIKILTSDNEEIDVPKYGLLKIGDRYVTIKRLQNNVDVVVCYYDFNNATLTINEELGINNDEIKGMDNIIRKLNLIQEQYDIYDIIYIINESIFDKIKYYIEYTYTNIQFVMPYKCPKMENNIDNTICVTYRLVEP